ncbi:MAG: SDR family NAD(P)-dependent oxidoreductase [Ignavibacteriae bacterium]|nr:SDR family NAD(P)-dependent oxidoreductase [Ignavibacteriota bacterium]NOG99225.1 SDR family NAD(P)-dependent oxidoreductase [Ignavibacteriota bacterium]
MKTALITGANKGIGFEVCRQLGEKNFHIILTARNKERGLTAVDKLKENDINAEFILMDVSNEESVSNAFNKFKELNLKLDVLINNAGILIDKTSIIEIDTEAFVNTMFTNSVSVFWVIKYFLPLINDKGRIINMSSGLGAFSEMSNYAPSYSVSKAAMNALTKQFSFALESKNIAVNSVSPGWVRTDMGGANASRSVEEGADNAVWLASEADIQLTGKFFRDRKEIEW